MNNLFEKINKNPNQIGLNLSIKDLESVIKHATKIYYSDKKSVLSDNSFDILQDILKQRDPTNPLLKKIGSQSTDINKHKLPYWMGSMSKIKPNSREESIYFNSYKGPYVISEKLDGVSGLLIIKTNSNSDGTSNSNGDGTSNENSNNYLDNFYEFDDNLFFQLFSRGDGSRGLNLNKLIEHINFTSVKEKFTKSLAHLLKQYNSKETNVKREGLVIRGEIIIDKDTYDRKYSSKYPKSLSLINGVINSKNINTTIAKDLRFVVYEIITPKLNVISQFNVLEKLYFNVARNELFNDFDKNQLPSLLMDFKSKSKYNIDGIIVSDSSKYYDRVVGKNPKHSVAFKMLLNEQLEETTVVDVEYNISKHGVFKPRVKFVPVKIGGDKIEYATGFHARYIKDNKIGNGAKIQIVKSGGVIPYIYSVLKPANMGKMPDGQWKWSDNKLEAILINKNDNMGLRLKRLIHFFETLKVVGLGKGVVERLFNAGYDDINKIIKLTPNMIASLEGFQLKSATTIVNSIHKVIDKPISLDKLMTASNCFDFGFGEKRLQLVLNTFPNIIKDYKSITLKDIIDINGFSDKTAKLFLEKLPLFINWLQAHPTFKYHYGSKSTSSKTKSNLNPNGNPNSNTNKDIFENQMVVMTGFTNDNIKDFIEERGGKVMNQISGKTTILICKDTTKQSTKLLKAKEMNIPIYSVENFISEYKIS